MFKRNGRALPLGNKPRGYQRPLNSSAHQVAGRTGPGRQQSVLGTQAGRTPAGVFPSASGDAGYRTLLTPSSTTGRQPFSLGVRTSPFFTGAVPPAFEGQQYATPFGLQSSGRSTPLPPPTPNLQAKREVMVATKKSKSAGARVRGAGRGSGLQLDG